MNRNLDLFYKQFKKYFIRLVNNIDGDIEQDHKSKIVQDIYNRIFFIYFLCNNNLIKANGTIISGREFFSTKTLNTGSILKNLNKFFSPSNNLHDGVILWGDLRLTCPFFNKDLFSLDLLKENLNVKVNNQDWNDFFNFLNDFEWTMIDDNSDCKNLNKSNKTITPEILGYLHERLSLEREKKTKGIYYTPPAISEYICIQSIISFLLNDLGIKGEEIFHFHKILENENNKRILREKLDVLYGIRILDPSCGTGAFLIKTAEVLFSLITFLNSKLKILRDPCDIKKHILINNLHGVDISKHAIEITRLRLWLWLMSSYSTNNKMASLPKIEYNIMVGNSLVGWNREKLIVEPSIHPKGIYKPKLEKILDIVEPEIAAIILKALSNLEAKKFTKRVNAYQELKKIYINASNESTMLLKEVLMMIKEHLIENINVSYTHLIQNKLNNKDITVLEEDIIRNKPFHWKFEFGSVLQNGGFDIIVGNPPYVFTRGMKFGKFERKFFKESYLKDYNPLTRGKAKQSGKLNAFSLFLIRSIELLKTGGHLGFIIPNTILRTSTNDIVRQFLLDHSHIEEIVDLGGGIFRGVTASAIIMILKKISYNSNEKTVIKHDVKDLLNLEYLKHEVNQERFHGNVICCYNIHVSNQFKQIFDKMKKNTFELGEISSEIIEGLVTRKNDDLFIKDSKINGAKKLIRGKNIDRYKINWPEGQYLIYDPSRLHRARAQHIHDSPEKIVIQRIGGGPYPLRAAYDNEQYYIFASTNAIILKKPPKIDNFTYEMKYILAILNSTLINGFYLLNYSNRSEFTVNITKTFIETLPIKKVQERIQKKISIIVDYIIYLNKFHPNEEEIRDFYDWSILDGLIYEIYLKSEFDMNLSDLIFPYLKQIEILTNSPDYIKIIKNTFKKMKNDPNLQEQIKKIKNNSITIKFNKLFQTRVDNFGLNN